MASLVDSVKTVAGDSHPFFKIAALAFVIFVVIQLETYDNVAPVFKMVAGIAAFFTFLGFILESIHNSVTEENIIMPGLLNPLKLIMVGVQGTLSLLPFLALLYFGISWVNSILPFAPWINYIILGIVFVTLLSFFVVSMLLYCRNYNAMASYNFKNIFKYSGDFIAYNFVLALNVLLLVGVVFVPIGIAVKLIFDFGLVFDYYVIFAIIFVIMVVLQYYSQLYFEYIDLRDT